MSVTYRTMIQQTGNNTGIPVPDEVLDDLGAGRRPRVVADVDGYVMSASVGSMGGLCWRSARRTERPPGSQANGKSR